MYWVYGKAICQKAKMLFMSSTRAMAANEMWPFVCVIALCTKAFYIVRELW